MSKSEDTIVLIRMVPAIAVYAVGFFFLPDEFFVDAYSPVDCTYRLHSLYNVFRMLYFFPGLLFIPLLLTWGLVAVCMKEKISGSFFFCSTCVFAALIISIFYLSAGGGIFAVSAICLLLSAIFATIGIGITKREELMSKTLKNKSL